MIESKSRLRFAWMVAPVLAFLVPIAFGQDKPKIDATDGVQEKAQEKSAPEIKNSALRPEPRPGAWMARHERFLERTKQGDVDLLFLGDSITAGWNENVVWRRYYGARKSANFGIGGDRTQHILWRLEKGEGDGLTPKVVVLMIGTNNLGSNSDAEIVEGIAGDVAKIRAKFPETKVLLLGIFPRGANRDKEQMTAAVEPRGCQDQRAGRQARRRPGRPLPQHRRPVPQLGRDDPGRRDARLPPPERQGLPVLGRGDRADSLDLAQPDVNPCGD